MKRLFIALLAACPLLMVAQARLAVVNSQEIFDAMPQKAVAEQQLKVLSDRLHSEYQMLQDDFDKKFNDYQSLASDATTPAAIAERRVQELRESDKRIEEFQQKAATEIAAQREALMAPIRQRIAAAIKAVGDEGGYELIIDTAVTPVAYVGVATHDLTSEVKARLGL
jgi:outer membrane protein